MEKIGNDAALLQQASERLSDALEGLRDALDGLAESMAEQAGEFDGVRHANGHGNVVVVRSARALTLNGGLGPRAHDVRVQAEELTEIVRRSVTAPESVISALGPLFDPAASPDCRPAQVKIGALHFEAKLVDVARPFLRSALDIATSMHKARHACQWPTRKLKA